MTLEFSNALKTAALAGLLGLAGLAAMPSAAFADYTTTRCDADGDRCWVLRCEDDGDDCARVRSYRREDYRSYDRPRPRWGCEDDDEDDCHWVYPRARYYYGRPHVGLLFGWHG